VADWERSGTERAGGIWKQSLAEIDGAGLYPALVTVDGGATGPRPVIDGQCFLSFAGNNYLGLSDDPAVTEAACQAIRDHGIGPGFSRAIGGTPALVAELEATIAEWTGFEACLAFPTGYMANVGVIRAMVRPILSSGGGLEPVVFVDQFMHGSVIDGCALAQVKVLPFRHNDPDDLDRRLGRYPDAPKLIVIEGVYTLEGTIVDLPPYVAMARGYGALLMVDDAHGVGLIGPKGGGTGSLYGDTSGIDLYMGCMDKALGATGGFLCGSRELIRLLLVACRSSVLSSCFPVGTAGGVLEAIRIIRESNGRRERALQLARRLETELRRIGLTVLGDERHPSLSVLVGLDCVGLEAERRLFQAGIHQPVIRFPAVPKDKCRFRVNVTSQHTESDLFRFAESIAGIAGSLGFV